MQPLARWTIGKTTKSGEETLRHSIKRFSALHPEFDKVICFNNMTNDQIDRLESLGVPLHEQKSEELDYPLENANGALGANYSMPGWGWKLVPPRLRPETHELWIDNDIIFRSRLPSLDLWLKSDRTIISEGLKRAYGIFEDFISDDTPYCAGFFGLPPHFDFSKRISHHCKNLKGKPLGHYDEQGLTTTIVLEGNPIVIPLTEIKIVKKLVKPYAPAMHFIGVNRTNYHEAWEQYKCYLLM